MFVNKGITNMQHRDNINEIFGELSDSYTDKSLDSITWQTNDSVAYHVASFAEVITEWYLYDSSTEKDIKSFLISENIDDIFDESEFIDLICGKAYLQNDIVQLISLKLPFKISLDRLLFLNNDTKRNNPGARLIKKFVLDKIKRQSHINSEIKAQTKKEKSRARDKRYYEKNREYLVAKKLEYWRSHKPELLKKKKEKYHANKEYYKEYAADLYQKHKEQRRQACAEYHKQNRDKVLARQRQYYAEHKDEFHERKLKYYSENKIRLLKNKKQYDAEHRAEIKKYYETHKTEISIKNEEMRKRRRMRAKMARNICAVYLFLMNLKKQNAEQYSKLFRAYQDPISNMVKTCVALQNMDFNLCPLAKNLYTNCKQCSCPKVFKVPGAVSEIEKYIQILKQNQKS